MNIVLLVFWLFVFIVFVTLAGSTAVTILADSKYRKGQKASFVKNKRIIVPIVVLIFIAFPLSGNQLMKSHEIYKQSTEILLRSPQVKDYLGEPINLGFVVTGKVSAIGGGHIKFSVSGPRGNGILYAEGSSKGGRIKLKEAYLVVESGKKINLIPDKEKKWGQAPVFTFWHENITLGEVFEKILKITTSHSTGLAEVRW